MNASLRSYLFFHNNNISLLTYFEFIVNKNSQIFSQELLSSPNFMPPFLFIFGEKFKHLLYVRAYMLSRFSCVQLFVTPWTAAYQASLSFTPSQTLFKLMCIKSVKPSCPLLSSSPPVFNLSQLQGLFYWVRSSHQVAKVLELQLQHHSFQWIFRIDFL